MIKKLVLWVLVIACMGTIFFFSSQEATESSALSKGFIVSVIRLFDVSEVFSEEEVKEISTVFNNVIRTTAHFAIYGLLGFLTALLFGEYKICGIRQLIYSVLCSAAYSCTDEFHQSFVKGRSAQLSDFITDTLGALCGAIFAILIVNIIKKYKKNRAE